MPGPEPSKKVGLLAAQCQTEACQPHAESPWVRGCPVPCGPARGGPAHVPGGCPLSFPGTGRCGERGPRPRPGPVRPARCFCRPLAFLLSSGLALSNPRPFLEWHWVAQPGGVTALLSPQGPLLRWLKVNFSEAFIAWIHIKALRVFVESVLR